MLVLVCFCTHSLHPPHFIHQQSATCSFLLQHPKHHAFSFSPPELPLEFLTPLKNLEVYTGDSATFEAESNKPGQAATWYKGGQKITPDYDARYNTQLDGTWHRLVISHAVTDDVGKFKLVIKDAKTSATLGVSGKQVQLCVFTGLARNCYNTVELSWKYIECVHMCHSQFVYV